MEKDEVLQHIGLGAAAGLIGTAALQAARTAGEKVAPRTAPPLRADPGEYMVNRAGQSLPDPVRASVTGNLKTAASTLLAFGYGSTGAALYSAIRKEPRVLLDGAALGATIWAIGYLGWLPALRLAPPVRRQSPGQIAMSLAQHLIYGVATVGAYRQLRRAVS